MDERDEHPWANAAESNKHDAEVRATYQVGAPDEWGPGEQRARPRAEDCEEVDPDGCGFKTLYQGLQLWHLIDVFVGTSIILYGSFVSVSTIAVAFILGVGILMLFRALCGMLALSTQNTCHRCGLPVSAGTSPILACTWILVAAINLIFPGHVRHYLEEHQLLWSFLQKWAGSHTQTLSLMFLGAFLLECARWQLVQSLHRKLISLEAAEDARARSRSDLRNRLANRPWWFARGSAAANDGSMSEPLLTPRAWTLLGRPQRTRGGGGQNLRDDASVDFASVQDEWAGRAEEDPHWWSRDVEEEHLAITTGDDHSWAEEK